MGLFQADSVEITVLVENWVDMLLPDLEFTVCSERLASGETLFAFTDGVTDARDPADEAFGEERLMALLQTEGMSAAALLERVDTALSDYMASAAQFDDVAMLATRRIA